ncbi:EamA family transporter [Pedobacter yulinensis]|uniref:EamA family transporter n=1 Tax=Pedobacter yulinensis TaxID=2126353 RepID=A0A2T3HPD4_9SPHI|nr:EamA family transporter [Pedobacter yulinensis]PST84304.1 EamA family transporter [Pedobacter yulinensis]
MKNQSLLVLLAFVAIYFIWGTTYLANQFALLGFPPMVLSSARYLLAGLLLGTYCLLARIRWPRGADVKVLVVSGLLMLIGGSGLVTVAQGQIHSGYAAAVVATEPLWFILLDRKCWKWYFSNRKVLSGVILGFISIALFCYLSAGNDPQTASSAHWTGTAILLLSAVLWVAGTLYARSRLDKNVSNLTASAVQLLAAGMVAAVIAGAFGEWQRLSPENLSVNSLLGLAYMIIMGSLIAFLAFNYLVRVRPPAVVGTHTYVNPIVAIFMGWLVAGEHVTLPELLCLFGVLAGVLLTRTARLPEEAAAS